VVDSAVDQAFAGRVDLAVAVREDQVSAIVGADLAAEDNLNQATKF